METKRCFLAIPIKDANLIANIERVQEKLADSKADVKFVEKENIHYNLKFFGEKTEDEISKIIIAVDKTLISKKRFEIEIGGIGVFPDQNFIRVIWLGLKKGEREIISLAQDLEKALSSIGIEKETRPFQAHLTLCRVRSTNNIELLKKKINEEKDVKIGKMPVDEVVLYQSILKGEGPEYIEIRRFRLL